MELPAFRYHPDPLRSGSIVAAPVRCAACGETRDHRYDGPVYGETDVADGICPWCIADGTAAERLGATFVDSEAFASDTPDAAMTEIMERTPGYAAWQSEMWPACCGDATAFIGPTGIAEVRAEQRELELPLLSHIIHEMRISGRGATRLLDSLDRDAGPTAYVFRCLTCERAHFHIDGT